MNKGRHPFNTAQEKNARLNFFNEICIYSTSENVKLFKLGPNTLAMRVF